MASHNAIATEIERFVRQQFTVDRDDTGFTRTTDLFENGYVDSVGVVELIEYVGGQYGAEIPDEDLLSDEFSTVDGIAAIIVRLLDAGRSSGLTLLPFLPLLQFPPFTP